MDKNSNKHNNNKKNINNNNKPALLRVERTEKIVMSVGLPSLTQGPRSTLNNNNNSSNNKTNNNKNNNNTSITMTKIPYSLKVYYY
jgi:hypothetical protein